jgi:hypothetical protein
MKKKKVKKKERIKSRFEEVVIETKKEKELGNIIFYFVIMEKKLEPNKTHTHTLVTILDRHSRYDNMNAKTVK